MATLPQYVDLSLTVERALQIIRGEVEHADGVLVACAAARLAYEYDIVAAHRAAARALHVPDGSHDCKSCNAHVTTGEPVQWPCPTATALGTPRLVMTVEWEPA